MDAQELCKDTKTRQATMITIIRRSRKEKAGEEDSAPVGSL